MPFGISFINTSTIGICETFGKFTGIAKPGLRFYIPFIQRIIPISNRLQQSSFTFNVKTKDNVFTNLGISVQYKINAEDSENAFYSLDNPLTQIEALIENNIRAKVPKMKLDELFESQDEICNSVSNNLATKMKHYGYTIETTLVTFIDPAKEVKDAMNRINASERLKEASKNEAEAIYINKVREAEADRDRKKLQGEGISQQRLAILKGYENGIGEMATRLGLTPQDIIQLVMKIQSLDTMEAIGKSQNTKTVFWSNDTPILNNTIKGILQANEIHNNK